MSEKLSQLYKTCRIEHASKILGERPFDNISEGLSVDVSGLTLTNFVLEVDVLLGDLFVEPSNGNTVDAA